MGDEKPTAWSVIVLDENAIRGEATAKWIGEDHACEVAKSRSEFSTTFNRTCVVTCIRDTGREREDLVGYIWEISPHTQILKLRGRETTADVEGPYDATLQEPYSKAELQQTVRRLFGRGVYARKLRRYYQLTSYLTGEEELAGEGSERTVDQIRERCSRLEAEIKQITSAYQEADFEAFLRSHRQRKRVLNAPSMDAEDETASKYRPSKCPNCGLTWGGSHGGQLGKGCERIAALVWRCLDCREIVHAAPGEYDKVL